MHNRTNHVGTFLVPSWYLIGIDYCSKDSPLHIIIPSESKLVERMGWGVCVLGVLCVAEPDSIFVKRVEVAGISRKPQFWEVEQGSEIVISRNCYHSC